MRASLRDLYKYAKTGIPSPDMRQFENLFALQLAGGGFPVATLTGVDSIEFLSDGTQLISWKVIGNERQTGTPTPIVPIQPEECGDLVESGEHAGQYAIQITCGGTTQTIYLTEPLRKIGNYADTISNDGTVTRYLKKMLITGTEAVSKESSMYYISGGFPTTYSNWNEAKCSHFVRAESYSDCNSNAGKFGVSNRTGAYIWFSSRSYDFESKDDFKQWLADQYSAGTPVCVWYILSEPTTETVNAPTITPASGSNTFSVGTTLAPSSVSITGHIQAAT